MTPEYGYNSPDVDAYLSQPGPEPDGDYNFPNPGSNEYHRAVIAHLEAEVERLREKIEYAMVQLEEDHYGEAWLALKSARESV